MLNEGGLHRKEDGQMWYLADVREKVWSTDRDRPLRFRCSEAHGLHRIVGGGLAVFSMRRENSRIGSRFDVAAGVAVPAYTYFFSFSEL